MSMYDKHRTKEIEKAMMKLLEVAGIEKFSDYKKLDACLEDYVPSLELERRMIHRLGKAGVLDLMYKGIGCDEEGKKYIEENARNKMCDEEGMKEDVFQEYFYAIKTVIWPEQEDYSINTGGSEGNLEKLYGIEKDQASEHTRIIEKDYVYQNGVLTILGTGKVDDASWNYLSDEIREIIISEGITNLVESRKMFKNLEKVICPRTFTTNIITNLFSRSTKLISAGPLGSGCCIEYAWTTEIPKYAFHGAHINKIEFPETMNIIYESAFSGCQELKDIELPKSVSFIGQQAFWSCDALSKIVINNRECKIYDDAITFPRSTIIYGHAGSTAIAYAKKYHRTYVNIDTGEMLESKEYDYEDGVLTILGTGNVNNVCWNSLSDKIKKIIISEGITYLYVSIEEYKNLEKVIYPRTLEVIRNPFSMCTGLTSAGPIGSGCCIEYAWTTEIPGGAFADQNSLEIVKFPETINAIWGCAFANCKQLRDIELPKSVSLVSGGVFLGCDALNKIVINNKECEIYDEKYTIPETTIIYGHKGSTAEAYAKKYNRTFVAIGSGKGEKFSIIRLLGIKK